MTCYSERSTQCCMMSHMYGKDPEMWCHITGKAGTDSHAGFNVFSHNCPTLVSQCDLCIKKLIKILFSWFWSLVNKWTIWGNLQVCPLIVVFAHKCLPSTGLQKMNFSYLVKLKQQISVWLYKVNGLINKKARKEKHRHGIISLGIEGGALFSHLGKL